MRYQVSRSFIVYSLPNQQRIKFKMCDDALCICQSLQSDLHQSACSACAVRHDVCGRTAAPHMLFRKQELSLQNVRSLSPVHLCGTLYLQISDSSLTLQLFLNANLKVVCFALFLIRNFLRFYCDYCNTLLYFILYCN